MPCEVRGVVAVVGVGEVGAVVQGGVWLGRGKGEAVFLEGIVPAGEEALEVSQGFVSVFVRERSVGDAQGVSASPEKVVGKVVDESFPESRGARKVAVH